MDVEVKSVQARAALHRALGDTARLAIVDALSTSDRTPGQLREIVRLDWNLLAFHLRVLEDVGVIERRPSEGDGRRRYVRLVATTLDRLGATHDAPVITHPLFVCTANSARSQFAAGLWRQQTGRAADSAGAEPAARVHPLAVETAAVYGVDLRRARPRGYEEVKRAPDVVVSVCDRALEATPPFEVPTLHWSIPDPANGGRALFEVAFADIADRVARLTGLAA
jgi:protein-tyrosine-phosphatase/DNA-binding HxlR family transcriptional regulator